MGYGKAIPRFAAAAVLAGILAGCEGTTGDAQGVRVETGIIGHYVPDTREWLSRLQAREHCAKFDKAAQIEDLKGSIAIYKCVPRT